MTGVELEHFRGDDAFHNTSFGNDDRQDMMTRHYDIMGYMYNTHTAPWTIIHKIGLQTGFDSGIYWMTFPLVDFVDEIYVYRRGDEDLYANDVDMPFYYRERWQNL